jgi:MFS family permease
MIAVGSAWPPLLATILLDRAGKGIRTAPRDAMISLSTPAERLGTAFGVHRALDTTGAMLGPLLAFALLLWTPTAFDSIFFVSFCFALVGLSVLLLFVKNPAPHPVNAPLESPTRVRSLSLLAERRFLALVLAGTILGVATMSDGFVYLGLQQELEFEPGMFPLLFVATAFVYMLLAVPMGRLADRVGRAKVFLGGNALLLLLYAALLTADLGLAGVVACTSLLGAYYAATDGVLTAMASAMLKKEVRGTGLAVLGTATTMSRLVSAVLFGALWTAFGYQSAVVFFAGFLVFSLLGAAVVLFRARAPLAHA